MTEALSQVGDYNVLIINDGIFDTEAENLTHMNGQDARQAAIERWGKPRIYMDVNCFLIRGADGVTLIDAGCGTDWGPKFGDARGIMRANGVVPEDVTQVLLTHIHGDHAFGLFGPDETPYFPNATVWAPQGDLSFYTDPVAMERTPEARRGNFKVASRLLAIYGDKVQPLPEGPVMDGITPYPLPGHSPGHSGFIIDGAGSESLLIWGDALHVTTLQPGDPDIGMIYDIDPAVAAASRRRMLDDAAKNGWIVAGGHLTGFGRVARDGDVWTIAAA